MREQARARGDDETMNDERRTTQIVKVGVMGAGAVGAFFGARLAAAGADVVLVGRARHTDAIARDGLHVRSATGTTVVPLAAATAVESLADRDVVLVTVKSGDTEAAADALAGTLGPEALVLSLQNGVDNAWRFRARAPQPVAPGVVYVSVEMEGPGRVRHNGGGRLIFGAPLTTADRQAVDDASLGRVVALFEQAGVPARVSSDIRVDLWTKLSSNCAYNAISALTRRRYGTLAGDADVRAVMTLVTDEIAAVAAADGVPVTRESLAAAARAIAEAMPQALSSTAQDLLAGRRTEIDDLNGFIVRRGTARGVATPANRTLHALVALAQAVAE